MDVAKLSCASSRSGCPLPLLGLPKEDLFVCIDPPSCRTSRDRVCKGKNCTGGTLPETSSIYPRALGSFGRGSYFQWKKVTPVVQFFNTEGRLAVPDSKSSLSLVHQVVNLTGTCNINVEVIESRDDKPQTRRIRDGCVLSLESAANCCSSNPYDFDSSKRLLSSRPSAQIQLRSAPGWVLTSSRSAA